MVTGKREGGGGDGTGTLEKDLLQNTLYKTIGTTGKREQRGGGVVPVTGVSATGYTVHNFLVKSRNMRKLKSQREVYCAILCMM